MANSKWRNLRILGIHSQSLSRAVLIEIENDDQDFIQESFKFRYFVLILFAQEFPFHIYSTVERHIVVM